MEKKDERIVYHYCPPETFKAIIENKTIRFSDIAKSNDYEEIKWISRYSSDFSIRLYCLFHDNPKLQEEFDCQDVLDELSMLIEDIFGRCLTGDERIYRFYIACFSEARDLLSQWRGYAKDGQGFAIGFDRTVLLDKIENASDHCHSVVYSLSKQKRIVNKQISAFLNDIKKLARNGQGKNQDALNQVFNNLARNLMDTAYYLKNPFFSEEKEWRMCFSRKIDLSNAMNFTEDIPKGCKVKFNQRDGEFIPYFDLPFVSGAVKEVILGPTNSSSMSDIETFMRDNGFDCSIERSAGSYRTINK